MSSRWPVVHILELATYSRAGEVIDKNFWGKGTETLYTCAKDPVRSNFPNFPDKKRTVEGDILLARNGYGYVYFPKPGSIYTNVVQRIQIDRKRAYPKYIWHVLNSRLDRLRGVGQGIPSLNMSVWNALDIPLPPLDVQKEIILSLEQAEGLNKKREEADMKMAAFAPALFHQMFGDPGKNEKGWEVKSIGEISEVIAGSTPDTKNPDYWNGDINWVTPAEMDDESVIICKTQRQITKAGFESCSTKIFPKDSVILSTRAPIGKVAITGTDMCSNQGIKTMVPKTDLILNTYLYWWLKQRTAFLNSLGSGATFKELSVTALKTIKIPLPTIQLQKEFEQRISEARALQDRQKDGRKKLEEVFEGVMSELIA